MVLYLLCAFFDDQPWINNFFAALLLNIILIPITMILQIMKIYIARSRRLNPVGYLFCAPIIILSLVLIIIEGIESEPNEEELDEWGALMIRCVLWEVFFIDTWKGLI